MSCYSTFMPIPKTLNDGFFKKWSPEMAYVLGYFAADGSMLRNKRGAHFIEFTTTDRILLRHLLTTTNSNHKVQTRSRKGKKANWKIQYRIQIGSKEWFTDLIALGFTERKSLSLCFPLIPKSCVAHFIRGYFDGDGCVYFQHLKYADRVKKRWVLQTLFTSGSRLFLVSLHETLKRHGIKKGSLRKKTRGFELVFSHHDSLALYKLMYHTNPTSSLFLPRKRVKLERAIRTLGLDE